MLKSNKIKCLCFLASSAFIIGTSSPSFCFAETVAPPNGNPLGGVDKPVKELNVNIFQLLGWTGAILLAWGIGMLVLAFKNEDAEQKQRSLMLVIFAILLMGMRFIHNRVWS